MTTISPVQCLACTRLDREAPAEPRPPRCTAYPDGIPPEIALLGEDHRVPRGDEADGLTFDRASGADADEAWAWWERKDAARAARLAKDSANRGQRDRVLAWETRAMGADVTPGSDQLHHYWTRGKGLAKWRFSPHPWTTLVALLTEHVGPLKAKTFASRWFIEVFGYAAGSDLHRVHSGKPPRGNRIGPG